MVAVVIGLSLTSTPPEIDVGFEYLDKVEHTFAYLVLMGWFAQIYHAANIRLLFAVGLIVMGVGLEILQGLGGVRYFEYGDMVANSSGVLLGWLMGYFGIDRVLYRIENFFIKSVLSR